jgi:hypothetical protein
MQNVRSQSPAGFRQFSQIPATPNGCRSFIKKLVQSTLLLFVESVHRNDTSSFPISLLEHRLLGDRLRPRVDRLNFGTRVRVMGDQTPPQMPIDDFTVWAFPKDKQLLRGKRVRLLNQISEAEPKVVSWGIVVSPHGGVRSHAAARPGSTGTSPLPARRRSP